MRYVTAIALTVVALSATARAVTIADLAASRDAYDGQVVTVTGTVVGPVAAGSESIFDLRDGAARMTVISRQGPPAAGTRLTVTGTIRIFHEGDGGPEENTFPVVMREASRTPAP
jgi:hypothetical protein